MIMMGDIFCKQIWTMVQHSIVGTIPNNILPLIPKIMLGNWIESWPKVGQKGEQDAD